jgi:TRAP transporter 4TM/12TM fusion protein
VPDTSVPDSVPLGARPPEPGLRRDDPALFELGADSGEHAHAIEQSHAVEHSPVVDTDELIAEYDAERPARRLSAPLATAMAIVAAAVSVWVLYRVFQPINTQRNRMFFLSAVLPMTFLVYRPGLRRPQGEKVTQRRVDDPGVLDWVLAALSLVVCIYPLVTFQELINRASDPTSTDTLMGALALALVLEACRRTTGWALPIVCLAFFGYAYYSGYLPIEWVISTKGYDATRIVEHLYMTTEGIYGTALDVAATYIVLFTIYGAVLDQSGASKFFVDLSFAAFRRSRTAAGRTVTLAGFLLGTVSGSGTATAVSVGSVSWPILQRAGYPRDQAGGMIAAAGIGAILSPPTLGAAAFIVAEYMRISYLTVLLYATIPTLLYYLGILLAIEIDARRLGTRAVDLESMSAMQLLGRYFYHFSSLIAIIVLMAFHMTPFRAVTYATILAFALSFLDRKHALTPKRSFDALAQGALSVLPVAATCAAAGIITGVTTLTGLGFSLSDLVLGFADLISWNQTSKLVVTVMLAGVAVLILGLAVPVTASFIISAVIIAPILTTLGVGTAEAYMFIFYYAVLSEVSPPTALAAVASSAITGGRPYRTMMHCWRYTLPAFLVPFHWVLAPEGAGLLGQGPIIEVIWTTVVSAIGVAALAVVTGRWIFGATNRAEWLLAVLAAAMLLYLAPIPIGIGLTAAALAVCLHLIRKRSAPRPTTPTSPIIERTA